MNKIPEKHWVDYGTKSFRITAKNIMEKQVGLMIQMTQN